MVIVTRTRSGRHIKKPALFQPTESVLEDDYGTDEHDTDIESELDTDDELYDEDSEEEYEEDADENGNLKDFVVDDESESEEESA